MKYNLSPSELFEEAIINGEGYVGENGQLCVATGEHTGRAANDKYIVKNDALTDVSYGKAGTPLEPSTFTQLGDLTVGYLKAKATTGCYIVDFYAAGKKCRLIAEKAWHALFVTRMFEQSEHSQVTAETLLDPSIELDHSIDLTIIDVPDLQVKLPELRSSTFIACDFINGFVLIGGTNYAGEIKKSVFSFLAYKFPEENILPMHSSVTASSNGNDSCNCEGHCNCAGKNVTVFFGLSGTGKTTLSANKGSRLLGDDEHGWSGDGVFNFETGCYAKVIDLSEKNEPAIWNACNQHLTVLENVRMTDNRRIDFMDRTLTENTRAAYQLNRIQGALPNNLVVTHPRNIIMLTCDAFGVLPAVAKLNKFSAAYHFVMGYTAKVAGTEKGTTEPTATFSCCFGAPFMLKNVMVYADLLMKRIDEHQPDIFLVNTGWFGGGYGVGNRISIQETRKIIDNIVSGQYKNAPCKLNKTFNLNVIEGSFNEDPRSSWNDKKSYDDMAKELVEKFRENAKTYQMSDEILNAGIF